MKRLAIALTALLLLGSCTGLPPMADRAMLYNQALADSANRLILINAVRASKRLPTYYTRITNAQSEGLIQPKVSVPFDIGPGASEVFKVTAELIPSQKDVLSIQPLDDQKFTRGVLTPMPADMLKFYLDQGWPRELVLLIALERIELGAGQVEALGDRLDELCASRDNVYCARREALKASLKDCAGRTVILNDPERRADLACFQATIRTMLALGFTTTEGVSFDVVNKDIDPSSANSLQQVLAATKEGYFLKYRKKGSAVLCKRVVNLHFTIPGEPHQSAEGKRGAPVLLAAIQGAPKADASLCEDDTPSRSNRGGPTKPMRLVPRSPDAMVYYLGEMMRASENLGNTVHLWSRRPNRDGTNTEIEPLLFAVHHGPLSGRTATKVLFERMPYWIAASCTAADCADDDRSMQAVTFVNQVLGLLKEVTAAPFIPSFTVIGN